MPIYEYHCEPCDHTFETLVRSASDTPRCPKCGQTERLVKQFSVPAAARSGAGASSSLPVCSPAGCGAPQCGGGMCGMMD